MFKKFPLLYIALMYLFSTKDKIVFFMQQFASLVISLCIGVIICCFSVMNGFTNQAKESFFKYTPPIIISTIDLKHNDINKDNLVEYNQGFVLPTLKNKHIVGVEYIRNQMTSFEINKRQYYGLAYEVIKQQEPFGINERVAQNMNVDKNVLSSYHTDENSKKITVIDPNSYNSLIGGVTRRKSYDTYRIYQNTENSPTLYFSNEEYQKLFHNTNYNSVKIYLDNTDYVNEVVADLKHQLNNSNIIVNGFSYEESPIFETIQLQKKIFVLIYVIMFILLCSIIVSSNVAFFKEKRKDWALFKILNPLPYSVEIIFLYKNILSFLITTILGLGIGILFTIYSNEIIGTMGYFMQNKALMTTTLFGSNKITYQFLLNDFLLILVFSFLIFFLNFIILLAIFRKENVANFLKAP